MLPCAMGALHNSDIFAIIANSNIYLTTYALLKNSDLKLGVYVIVKKKKACHSYNELPVYNEVLVKQGHQAKKFLYSMKKIVSLVL